MRRRKTQEQPGSLSSLSDCEVVTDAESEIARNSKALSFSVLMSPSISLYLPTHSTLLDIQPSQFTDSCICHVLSILSFLSCWMSCLLSTFVYARVKVCVSVSVMTNNIILVWQQICFRTDQTTRPRPSDQQQHKQTHCCSFRNNHPKNKYSTASTIRCAESGFGGYWSDTSILSPTS